MSYRRILVGDVNVGRFWQAIKGARPQLSEVPFLSVTCLDTLEAALEKISDELDFAIVSMVTSVLIDECSAMDVRASAANALDPVVRRIVAAAKKSAHCQVFGDCLFLWVVPF